MPDRVFRDEIMSSPRYWQLSSDTARMLFFHLGLRADDFGIFRAANYTIRQECFGADNKPAPEALAKMLCELNDADLIRLYRDSDKAEYGFIPRWKQRLRMMKPRFPLPPSEIWDKSIKDLIEKMPGRCPTDDGHLPAEVESKGSGIETNRKEGTSRAPPVDKSADTAPWRTFWMERGKSLGIISHPGEGPKAYCDRVIALSKAKTQ